MIAARKLISSAQVEGDGVGLTPEQQADIESIPDKVNQLDLPELVIRYTPVMEFHNDDFDITDEPANGPDPAAQGYLPARKLIRIEPARILEIIGSAPPQSNNSFPYTLPFAF